MSDLFITSKGHTGTGLRESLLNSDALKNPTMLHRQTPCAGNAVQGNASGSVVLLVEGMMCMKNCGTTVRNALQQVGSLFITSAFLCVLAALCVMLVIVILTAGQWRHLSAHRAAG